MIDHILSPIIVEALGWTLLHSLWQGAVFAILLVLILIALRSYTARSRYVVSVGLLCAFFLTVSTTFFLQWQEASASYDISGQLFDTQRSDDVLANNSSATLMSSENAGKNILPILEDKSQGNQSSLLIAFRDYYDRHLPLLVTIWFVGILFLQLRFLGQLAYVQRLKHYGTQLFPTGWSDKIEELEGKLRIQKKVSYLTSLRIDSPMVIGWLKPVILLPQQLFNSLSDTEIYTVLAHELAHIRREDFIINLIQTFLCNVFFFHPGVWWMSHRIDDEREHCCDDLAVAATGPVTSYAKTLINVSELQLRMKRNPSLAMALSGKSNSRERGGFSGRIRRLFKVNNGTGAFREGFATACILITAAFFGIAATGSTVSDTDQMTPSSDEHKEISNLVLDDPNKSNEISITTTANANGELISKTSKIANIEEIENPANTNALLLQDDTRIDALVMACGEGDLDFVKTLVRSGIDVNGLGSEGFTPLMMAASEDEVEIVEYLIEEGADVDKTYNGWNALIEAVHEGSLGSMKYLLEAGAKVNYYKGQGSPTAITMAASEGHLECLKLLIANRADINGFGESFPPLHSAAEEGKRDIVNYLISQKVAINKKDANGRTALMYAASEGEESLMKKLISSGADISIVDGNGNSAVDYIEEETNDKRIYLGGTGKPEIHQATHDGLIEKVQRMVEQGIDVDTRDRDGQTPLHIAASENHTIDMRVLMEMGAEINTQDNDGRTPLMYAAANGKRDAVVLLVSKEANVNIRDKDDMRAYEWARFGRNSDIMKFLDLITKNESQTENNKGRRSTQIKQRQRDRQQGNLKRIQSNAQNNIHTDISDDGNNSVHMDIHTDIHTDIDGRTEQSIKAALKYAEQIEKVIQKETEQREKVRRKDFEQNLKTDQKVNSKRETLHVTNNGYHLRQYDLKEEIPELFEVIKHESVELCAEYLERGIDANASDDTGQTALMVAATSNRLDMARYLIKEGADVNKSSKSGLTALHYAALENHDQMARLLLKNNAKVDATMHYSSTDGNYSKEPYVWEYIGATPLLIAVESGNIEVISVLIDAGANTSHRLVRNEYLLNKDRVSYLSGSEVMGLDKDFLKEVEFKTSDNKWTPYKQALLLNEPSILVYFKKNR